MAELDPYRPPQSQLTEATPSNDPVSVEEALTRGWDFRSSALIRYARERVDGTKSIIFWGTTIWLFCLAILSGLLVFFLAPDSGHTALQSMAPRAIAHVLFDYDGSLLPQLLAQALCLPMLAGVYMVGVRAAADQPYNFAMVFGYYHKLLPLAMLYILQWVLVTLGFVPLIIGIVLRVTYGLAIPVWLLVSLGFLASILPIYLLVAYCLATPLLLERGLSPWKALTVSRRATAQHWFKIFNLLVGLWLTIFVGVLGCPALMGLGFGLLAGHAHNPIQIFLWVVCVLGGLLLAFSPIWTYPRLIIAKGELYRTIFGVLPVEV